MQKTKPSCVARQLPFQYLLISLSWLAAAAGVVAARRVVFAQGACEGRRRARGTAIGARRGFCTGATRGTRGGGRGMRDVHKRHIGCAVPGGPGARGGRRGQRRDEGSGLGGTFIRRS